MGPGWEPVPRAMLGGTSTDVAPWLLGVLLVVGGRAGRIVETEAYLGPLDEASHAFRGRTRRNATMFGPPGHLYVYFTYGMHWCANVVTGGDGEAQAVLLRALEPVAGLEEMRAARPAARRDLDLCRGPARLCQALGITGSHDGSDLTVPGPDRPWLALDGQPRPAEVVAGVRVGISKAVGHPWRFAVAGSRYVSAPRLTGSPGGSSGG
jgi:DNA-3-methyladenine glycosylase